MQPAISVRNLTKVYGESNSSVTALRGVTLDVHPGELVMLMGPSGSGKTTLLSIMGCILTASSGSVCVGGREVGNLRQKELPKVRLAHIGFVFQNFNLFPTLTAGENVELALDLKGTSTAAARKRARDLLEQVGIGEKYNTFPADLSGGQKQRVAIARALANDPDVILADEPTAALDLHTARGVMELMSRLAHERGRAVVIVTHDSRLLDFVDRVVKMEDGLIVGSTQHRRNTHPVLLESDEEAEADFTQVVAHVGAAQGPLVANALEAGRGPASTNGKVFMAKKILVAVQKRAVMSISTIFALVLLITLIMARGHSASASSPADVSHKADAGVPVAGPGQVEPSSEDINLGSELSGKLKSVNVEEGTTVKRGQVLAVIENADLLAEVVSSEGEVSSKSATLRKVQNGARSQERLEALSSVRGAEAVMNNAKAELERREKLFAAGVISREELERYVREYDVAKANHKEAVERHSLVDDHAREEDVAFAQADLQLAKGHLEEARARYEKSFIRSPIDGIVLRKHHRTGESVSNSSVIPDPIVTIGDNSVVNVRVDVDEADISKLRVGQRAYVTADAFAGQRFTGHVIRISQQLGPKNVRTNEPTEKVDKKILETLVELDKGIQLPIGLRVDAFIQVDGPQLESRR